MNAFRRRPGRAASSAALATTVPSPTHRPTPPPPTGPWQDGLGRAAIRSAQTLLLLALASVLVWGLTQVKLLVIPVLIAAILAAAFSPLVRLFRRWGWPRALATWAALLLGLGTLGVVLWLVGRGIRKEWPTLVEEAERGLGELEKFLLQGPLGITEEQIASARESLTAALTSDQVQSGAITGATAAAEGVAGLLLGVVVLFFLMKDGRSIYGFLIRPLSEERQARAWRVGNRSVGVLGGYVRGTAIVALVDAVVIGAALVILRVPLALPLATIVFLGAFVPLIGATVAGILATLVALVTNGPTTALIVLVVVIAVNQLEGDLLAPVVIGRALALHPLAILLALTAGTILSGIIGALLAVPITAVAWAAITEWQATDDDDGGGRGQGVSTRLRKADTRH
ncbi:AI-2E family transporter [Cellulomonas cellasea]|uniref:Putative PurR-regulated permease PerM n=1 Tax=Cellulomonas cellasea TaxID=43670 RepID=A0A7W4YCB3_9CELL|nr:AI-2E family transporter [Cellulomonas cellasea]MBB2923527.1 putative PurR-regulated permease PerM [Cellulomonas cellasea]